MVNKRKFLLICFCLISKFLFSQTFSSKFKNNNTEVMLLVESNSSAYIASIYFSMDETSPQIGFEGSGYRTLTSFYDEDDANIYVKVLYLWEGAEEIDSNDQREIDIYNLVINKNTLENEIKKKKGNFKVIRYRLDYDSLIFKAQDSNKSINNKNDFFVKTGTDLLFQPSQNSSKLFHFDNLEKVTVLDMVLDNSKKEEVWVKIKSDKLIGYIPLVALADEWKILRNELHLCVRQNELVVLCNDDGVRIRTEPNLNCETLGYLNKYNEVIIHDRSNDKFTIDGEDWYWYKVSIYDGTIGWVYGKYLNIEE